MVTKLRNNKYKKNDLRHFETDTQNVLGGWTDQNSEIDAKECEKVLKNSKSGFTFFVSLSPSYGLLFRKESGETALRPIAQPS